MSGLRAVAAALLLILFSAPAKAEQDAYVTANLRAILYHELGHAIIDLAQLPIFGQEEDAADVASILLIDVLFQEDAAVAIAYHSAFGYLAEAEEREANGEDVAWWGVHGADLQRYYNLVCLFVGADMDARADVAEELGLPRERLDTCEEEFDLANESWGPVFDDLAKDAPGETLVYRGDSKGITEELVALEVAALNQDFALPQVLTVRVESCGEPNAYYDPEEIEIIMCTEFADWLSEHNPAQ